MKPRTGWMAWSLAALAGLLVVFNLFSPERSSAASFSQAELLNAQSLLYFPLVQLEAPAFYPNDPAFAGGLQWPLERMRIPWGWPISTGKPEIVIAVVDFGVAEEHPDLAGRLLPNTSYLKPGTPARGKDVKGWNTSLAGIMAANTDNGLGIAGITREVKILSVQIGIQEASIQADAIRFAGSYPGVAVVILDLQDPYSNIYLSAAVRDLYRQGVVVVMPGGDCGGDDFDPHLCSYKNEILYPAGGSNVLAVSATDAADQIAGFSTSGNFIDVSAPGVEIYSTGQAGEYDTHSSSLMAAGYVAGVIALVRAAHPEYTMDQVVQAVLCRSTDLGEPGWDPVYGMGRVDAYRALNLGAPPVPCRNWNLNSQ